MKERVVAVFPGTSENGLEVLRSLQFEKNIQLISLSSATDGADRFFNGVICRKVPLIKDYGFFERLKDIANSFGVTHIFPVTSYAIEFLAQRRNDISACLIAPRTSLVDLFADKRQTLLLAKGIGVHTPRILSLKDLGGNGYRKPVNGFGAQGAYYIERLTESDLNDENILVTEFLPGEECTVEVLSDSEGIVFLTGRSRSKIRMGTAVAGRVLDDAYLREVGLLLWAATKIQGIWFFQMRRDAQGKWSLLEVDCRVAGSMGWSRSQGVNLPKLALWISDGLKVEARPVRISNTYVRHLAFKAVFINEWRVIFVDWDDTMVVNGRLNKYLVGFLFMEKSRGVDIKLLSKHLGDLDSEVLRFGITGLFDEIIHLEEGQKKEEFMCDGCLFIDDSFSQRNAAMARWNCTALGPDMSDLLFYGS